MTGLTGQAIIREYIGTRIGVMRRRFGTEAAATNLMQAHEVDKRATVYYAPQASETSMFAPA